MKRLDQYVIAKAGLVKLVNMRGGISTLEHNSEIRLVILWYTELPYLNKPYLTWNVGMM